MYVICIKYYGIPKKWSLQKLMIMALTILWLRFNWELTHTMLYFECIILLRNLVNMPQKLYLQMLQHLVQLLTQFLLRIEVI